MKILKQQKNFQYITFWAVNICLIIYRVEYNGKWKKLSSSHIDTEEKANINSY